ncbi:MAG: NAD(P)H-dependent oxidoreductase [Desulfobacterales bacterium]|jgi:multimeric flavodoxin WrbA
MLVVGFQGSPRRRGNTYFLTSTFLSEAERLGASVRFLEVDRMQVVPCKEYVVCEKKGYCPIEDEVLTEIYPLIREADLIVLGTPVFFYNMTAQLKAVIDRCQMFWARKYRLNLRDPKRGTKKGLLLSVAATRGKKLFDAIHLTVKNFCDAVDVTYADHLTYREIEGPTDMKRHPTVAEDIRALAEKWVTPLTERPRLLFLGRTDDGISQMAAAIAEDRFGARFEVTHAGVSAIDRIDEAMVDAMAGIGLDVAFRRPRHLPELTAAGYEPDVCIPVESLEAALPDFTHTLAPWSAIDEGRTTMAAALTMVEKRVSELPGVLDALNIVGNGA